MVGWFLFFKLMFVESLKSYPISLSFLLECLGHLTRRRSVMLFSIWKPSQVSIVRRSCIVAMFLLPAFTANFMLIYLAGKWMNISNFGILYVCISVGNIIFAPAAILNVAACKTLISAEISEGRDGVLFSASRFSREVVIKGSILAPLLAIALVIFGYILNVSTPLLAMLIVADAYTAYVAETGRITLQCVSGPAQVGLYTLCWMVLRATFGVIGILVFDGSVWGAMMGIITSALLVYIWFLFWLRGESDASAPRPPKSVFSLSLAPHVISLSLFTIICYIDIIAGYLYFSPEEMAAYAASATMPKAVLVASMPVIQTIFPVLARGNAHSLVSHYITTRLTIVAIATGGMGSVAIYMLSSIACDSSVGVAFCDSRIMIPILYSIFPLCLLRMIILVSIAKDRGWESLLLIGPIVLFFISVIVTKPDPVKLGLFTSALSTILIPLLPLTRWLTAKKTKTGKFS